MEKQNKWKKWFSVFLCLILMITPCFAFLAAVTEPLQEVSADEKTDSGNGNEADNKKEDGEKTEDSDKKEDDKTEGGDKKEDDKTEDGDKKEDDKKDDPSGEELQGKKKTTVSVRLKKEPTYNGEKIDPDETFTVVVKEKESGKQVKDPNLRFNYYTRKHGESKPSDSAATSTPKDAGNYWVEVYYKGDAGHKAAFADPLSFQITKLTPEVVVTSNITENTCIGDTVKFTAKLRVPGKKDYLSNPTGEIIFRAEKEGDEESKLIDTVKFKDGKAEVEYVMESETLKYVIAEFSPSYKSGEEGNYRRSKGYIKDVKVKKKDANSGGGTIRKVYGTKPFKLELSSENGTGAYTFESSDTSVATVAADGTVTVLHPGTTKITATKAADANYNASTEVFELTVIKGENTGKPKKIVEKEVTNNKIEVNVVEGQEYSVDGGKNWNTTGVFKKLKANKEYTVLTRLCETEYYAASSKTAYLKLKTGKQKLDKVDQDKDNSHSSSQNFGMGTGNKVNSLKGNDKQQVTTANRVSGTASSTSKEGTRKVNTLGKEAGQTAAEEVTEESSTAEEVASTAAEEATTEAEEENDEEQGTQKRSSTATVKAGMSVLILALAALTFIYFNKRETNL